MENEKTSIARYPKKFRFYHFLGAEYVENFFRKEMLKVTQLGHSNDYFEYKPGFLNPNVEHDWNIAIKGGEPCVVCLSTKMSSPVMWGHYGKRGKGACLVFDIPLLERSPLRKFAFDNTRDFYAYMIDALHLPIVKVSYTDKRLMINRMPPSGTQEFSNVLIEIASSKTLDWQYEEEYRIIVDTKFLIARNGNFFFKGMFQFCTAVLLGWECPISRAYLSAVLREEKREDVRVVDVHPSLTKCEITSCVCDGELYQDTSVVELDAWGI